LADDLAALHAVKKRLGSEIAVMVDYNQALSLAQALERGRALDQEGIYWLEEPIRHDDYAGNATLARELETPIHIGENSSESAAMAVALVAGPPIMSCPTSNASVASPAGCAPRRSPPPTGSRCRRTSFPR